MYQKQVNLINLFRMAVDALAVMAAGYLSRYLMLNYLGGAWLISANLFVGSILIVMFLNNFLLGAAGFYDDRRSPAGLNMVFGLLRVSGLSWAMLCLAIAYSTRLAPFKTYLFLFGGLSFGMLLAERAVLRLAYGCYLSRGFNRRQVLIVGNSSRSRKIAASLGDQLSWGHEVIGFLAARNESPVGEKVLGTIDDFGDVLKQRSVDEVIFAVEGDPGFKLEPYLKLCRRMGITIRIVPALWEPEEVHVSVEKCQSVPLISFYQNNFSPTGLLYKRLLDLLGGLVGCALLAVMYPFVALAIKLDSPGPVFFRQKRAGMNGRVFELYKFRTMYVDAEARKAELMASNKMQGLMFKMENDPRITRVGAFLRKTSLDEFPQFLNVLRGEISLVGTRPPTLDEVAQYEDWHHRRISAKPGITGLWQISGRNEITDFDEIVKLDCQYMDNWQPSDDMKILFKTLKVVFSRHGAI